MEDLKKNKISVNHQIKYLARKGFSVVKMGNSIVGLLPPPIASIVKFKGLWASLGFMWFWYMASRFEFFSNVFRKDSEKDIMKYEENLTKLGDIL